MVHKIKTSIILAMLLLGLTEERATASVLRAKIVRAIIGESANQSIDGQTVIACGVMNRPEGLMGVYGADMKRAPTIFEIATAVEALDRASPERCWALIRGADMWHSGYPPPKSWLGVPMVFVVKIGDHYFYRRLKGKE